MLMLKKPYGIKRLILLIATFFKLMKEALRSTADELGKESLITEYNSRISENLLLPETLE